MKKFDCCITHQQLILYIENILKTRFSAALRTLSRLCAALEGSILFQTKVFSMDQQGYVRMDDEKEGGHEDSMAEEM